MENKNWIDYFIKGMDTVLESKHEHWSNEKPFTLREIDSYSILLPKHADWYFKNYAETIKVTADHDTLLVIYDKIGDDDKTPMRFLAVCFKKNTSEYILSIVHELYHPEWGK